MELSNYRLQSLKVPRVIQFAFTNLEVTPGVSRSATCKYCDAVVTERYNVTSNWVKHLRKGVHPNLYDQYQEWLKGYDPVAVPVSICADRSRLPIIDVGLRHEEITDAITKELILAGSQPTNITEQPYFQRFMKAVEPTYEPVSHDVIIDKITEMSVRTQGQLKDLFQRAPVVHLTVSTWSDRKTLSYLAITGHAIVYGKLRNHLLAFLAFEMTNYRRKMMEATQNTIEFYTIQHKIGMIIYDGAKDLFHALTTVLPGCNPAHYRMANEGFWNDVDGETCHQIKSHLSQCSKGSIQPSFIHSLQLVVKESIKDLSVIDNALSKAFQIISLAENDPLLKEAFGPNWLKRTNDRSMAPWRSQLQDIETITIIGKEKLHEMLSVSGLELQFTTEDFEQLNELLTILNPFATACEDCLSESKVVTISFILPAVLALNHHLEGFQVKYLAAPLESLRKSLRKKFEGIFLNTFAESNDIWTKTPFGDLQYVAAAVLDPAFKLKFIDYDLSNLSSEEKVLRKHRFQRWTLCYVQETNPDAIQFEIEVFDGITEGIMDIKAEALEQQAACRRKSIFSYDVPQFANNANSTGHPETLDQELCRYLDAIDHCSDAIQFWTLDNLYPKLGKVAPYILSMPASCPIIEQMVAAGDISLKPLPGTFYLLSKTAVLRCNSQIGE